MTTCSVASPGIEEQEIGSSTAQKAHCALPFPEDTQKAEFGWVVFHPFFYDSTKGSRQPCMEL